MKKIFFSLCMLIATVSYSQDVMDKVAKETCECIAKFKLENKNIDPKDMSTQFGVCILSSYTAHSSELPNGKLDFSDEEAMKNLGESVALKMLAFCPEAIMELGKTADDTDTGNVESLTVTGEITEIKTEQFVSIVVKDDKARVHTFLMLEYFDTAALFTDKKLNKKDKVTVSYVEAELYDPKVKEFRYFKIITGLEKK